MSIKKQFYILSTLIIIIPVLFCLFSIFHRYISSSERMLAHGYKEIRKSSSSLFTQEDWNEIETSLKLLPPDVDCIVVTDYPPAVKFKVIFSTFSEFKSDDEIPQQMVWKNIENNSQDYFYQFSSPTFTPKPVIMITRIPRDKNNQKRNNGIFWDLLALLILFVLILIFYIIYVSKNIFSSISLIEKSTLQMASGDLSTIIKNESNNHRQNEITSINSNLEVMRKALVDAQNRKNKFIMGMSHDLRTPVAVIKGYMEALSDEVITDENEKKQTYSLISTKTSQLEGMINTLINYTKLESTDLRNKLQNDSITQTIKDFAKDAEITSTVYNRTVKTEINLNRNIEIPMDKQLVIRAFENLFSNALRYTKEGDFIVIKAFEENEEILFSISDTGCGIKKQDLNQIFELFYRGTNSRKEEGMGIGLSVVKNIIDTHGWKIQAESEEGKGSCFTITIPLKKLK